MMPRYIRFLLFIALSTPLLAGCVSVYDDLTAQQTNLAADGDSQSTNFTKTLSGTFGKNNFIVVDRIPPKTSKQRTIKPGGGVYKIGAPYRIKGRRYVPHSNPEYDEIGIASWYGPYFHGRYTANGETYDQYGITAAHTTLPMPSYAKVTNLENNRSMVVRINDRGPYASNRVIDLSRGVAELLDVYRKGTAQVRVQYLGPAPLHGRDENYLMSTYQEGNVRFASLIYTKPKKTKPKVILASVPTPSSRPSADDASGSAVVAARPNIENNIQPDIVPEVQADAEQDIAPLEEIAAAPAEELIAITPETIDEPFDNSLAEQAANFNQFSDGLAALIERPTLDESEQNAFAESEKEAVADSFVDEIESLENKSQEELDGEDDSGSTLALRLKLLIDENEITE